MNCFIHFSIGIFLCEKTLVKNMKKTIRIEKKPIMTFLYPNYFIADKVFKIRKIKESAII